MSSIKAAGITHSAQQGAGHGTLGSYITGFALSVALTLAAYFAVVHHAFSGGMLVAVIVAMAITQLLVQLVFFLHLGRESNPKWNLLVFGFMLIVLIILVFGTLWIMHNLDYHMMSPAQTDDYIMQDEGITR